MEAGHRGWAGQGRWLDSRTYFQMQRTLSILILRSSTFYWRPSRETLKTLYIFSIFYSPHGPELATQKKKIFSG